MLNPLNDALQSPTSSARCTTRPRRILGRLGMVVRGSTLVRVVNTAFTMSVRQSEKLWLSWGLRKVQSRQLSRRRTSTSTLGYVRFFNLPLPLVDTFVQGSDYLGSNSRCQANRSRSIGWNPLKTTEDFLKSIKVEVEALIKKGGPAESKKL